MVRKFLTVLMVGGTMAIAACNTVKGVGEDIQSVGETGEEAIN